MSFTLYSHAPTPRNEDKRNEAVYASGLTRQVDDPRLNKISRRARRLLEADWAGIALIVDNSQLVIASSGGQLGRYDRAKSMTGFAILQPQEVFCVPDAASDGRFGANPFVRVGLIRFFVAAAIVDSQGYALGALCCSRQRPGAYPVAAIAKQLQLLAADILRNSLNQESPVLII